MRTGWGIGSDVIGVVRTTVGTGGTAILLATVVAFWSVVMVVVVVF